ncbi:Cwf15/Cwc15 cell cycle control protein [Epithele typhae]|uniref:Cwf15/Cwc15 cell cycle control protein n=1 Tax=Epithele typhae TaxID=378194 RepID=UPI002008796D|nr:Cwf15/Cwc15 cell cycle control protein [Epithele typhae]KAH9935188.1 Cwf15/Cwc15 cell cycle control protein [Epithele typhae]
MSTAHRPTWDPAQAKDVKGGSRQFSVRDMAAHTKLKFRQPGQTSTAEVAKRDLRAELIEAEAAARDRKRKAEGSPRWRKLLQDALELDKDDDEDDEDEGKGGDEEKGGGDDEDDDDDDDDEEDDTAELLRELEKIKRERAEEKDRQEREQSELSAAERDAEIATANPLLNLAAALGQTPNGVNTTKPGTFAVKRRWDDDLIFKNQAMSSRDKNKEPQFVNDLLRTEFHKKFMSKFIKTLSFIVMTKDSVTVLSYRFSGIV